MTTSTSAQPNLLLTLQPTALEIIQGRSGSVEVTILRRSDLIWSVKLSLEGAPTGVNPTFGPSNPTSAHISTLLLNVSNDVATGTYNLTVKGVSSGTVRNATALLTLSVASNSSGTLALSLNPTALEAPQGSRASTGFYVRRSGVFDPPVTLSVEGLPTGRTDLRELHFTKTLRGFRKGS